MKPSASIFLKKSRPVGFNISTDGVLIEDHRKHSHQPEKKRKLSSSTSEPSKQGATLSRLLDMDESQPMESSIVVKVLEDESDDMYDSDDNNRAKKKTNGHNGNEPEEDENTLFAKRAKRGRARRKLEQERINPATSIMIYPDLENPRTQVIMSDEPTHSAPEVKVINEYTVVNEKGYRVAKASHGVWDGYWYYEVKINDHKGNCRIGWSQISGELQGPCGFDQFGYSFRDDPPSLFHKSTRQKDMKSSYLVGYGNYFFFNNLLMTNGYYTIPTQKKRSWRYIRLLNFVT